MTTDDQMLSWDATAQLLGVSRQALYDIVNRRKDLTPAKVATIGKQQRRFFAQHDVEALKRKREGEQIESNV